MILPFPSTSPSPAIFRRTEILQIIRGKCYTSQGDPDSSFPLWLGKWTNSNICHSVTDGPFDAEIYQGCTFNHKKEIPY